MFIHPSKDLDIQEKNNKENNENPLAGAKILLAEDSPDNQLLLGQVLEMGGADVDIASNGQEAIHNALMRKYDIILMDLQMPVLNGLEATTHLRSQGYSGPIIALTAHAMSEEKERCLAGGFNDHVSKPIDIQTLYDRLEKHIRKHSN